MSQSVAAVVSGDPAELIEPGPAIPSRGGDIIERERLGGLLKHYHRAA